MNCFVSTIVIVPVGIWILTRINIYFLGDNYWLFLCLAPMLVCHILGVTCTLLFVLFDNVFPCCCDCWRGEQEIVVYDPDNREANLVWRDGQVINMEQTQEDDENGADIELCEMESKNLL